MNDDPKPKSTQHPGAKPLVDPGKGKRTPGLWRTWLTDIRGLRRQMLQFLTRKSHTGGTYQGSVRDGGAREARMIRSRAKAKAGRRVRVQQQMARRGKR